MRGPTPTPAPPPPEVLTAALKWFFLPIDLPRDLTAKPWSDHCIGFKAGGDGTKLTAPMDINNNGVVVGFYIDANDAQHGFRRNADGSIDTIDVRLGVGRHPTDTNAFGINDAGYIVGVYVEDGLVRGFQCKPFPPGGANMLAPADFLTWAVNNPPKVVGKTKGAAHDKRGFGTFFTGINDAFQIVGFYVAADESLYGFTLTGGSPTNVGNLTWIRVDRTFEPWGLNAGGDVVGTTDPVDAKNPAADGEGFLMLAPEVLLAAGAYIPLEFPPGPKSPLFTTTRGVNSSRQVAGFYSYTSNFKPSGDFHGYVAYRNDVPFKQTTLDVYKQFDHPEPMADEVRVQGINDRGDIVGHYRVTKQSGDGPVDTWKGFILSPP